MVGLAIIRLLVAVLFFVAERFLLEGLTAGRIRADTPCALA